MTQKQQFIAIYLGSPDSAAMARWKTLSPEAMAQRQQQGLAAWHAWAKQHHASIALMGGPLGPALRVATQGVAQTANAISGFTIVEAKSAQAAAALFKNPPHFAIFPGEAMEIMPIMPVPRQGVVR